MELAEMQISLSVENGAAHVRLVRTHSEESLSVEALQRVNSRPHHESSPQSSVQGSGSPLSMHSMTLRSHARASLTPAPSPQSTADVDLPTAHTHVRAPGRAKRKMPPHAPVTPESDSSPPSSNAGSPSPAPRQPRISQFLTPNRSRFRAWELNTPPRFVIWEDPPESASQACPPGHVFEDIGSDNKENIYAAIMDYDPDHEQENQTAGTGETSLRDGPLGIFGMPGDFTFEPTLHQHFLEPGTTPSAQLPRVENNTRPAVQVALREGDEMDMEWNDGPSPRENEELARLNDTIERAAEQRWQFGRGSPVRHHNLHRQRRISQEARRTAQFRRQQTRRRWFVEAGSPR